MQYDQGTQGREAGMEWSEWVARSKICRKFHVIRMQNKKRKWSQKDKQKPNDEVKLGVLTVHRV